MTDHEDVAGVVQAMNDAWIEGRIDDLVPLFHEDVVMAAPDGNRISGRDAMIESFRQYVAVAKTHEFTTEALGVDVFDGTAVATMRFRVRYEISGELYAETGREILALSRGDDGWRIVWRTQIPGEG